MFIWRNALDPRVFFVVVGILYLVLAGRLARTIDRAGATMLLLLGLAMAFGFAVLMRGSRDAMRPARAQA